MEQILTYVKPELLVVAVVLYFVGMWIKGTEYISDKYIPMLLGLIGILLCLVWVAATTEVAGVQDAAMAIFTSVVQGVLVAGLSTYANQLIKQSRKDE